MTNEITCLEKLLELIRLRNREQVMEEVREHLGLSREDIAHMKRKMLEKTELKTKGEI